ncbi:unnamed protein product [Fusarium graminearum]|nr:unnamed protein product [Fusarium graminearum]
MSSESAVNTIDLADKIPLTTAKTIADVNCVESRVKDATIFNHAELTQQEKMALHDLLQGWCDTRPGNKISPLLQKMFFARIFESWNFDNDSVSVPVAPGKKQLAQVAVPVGTFKIDLPVTPMKRKSGEKLQNKTQGEQAEKARVQGYNNALIIALARARIIAFAKAGTVHPPVVAEDLRINHRLNQCILISDNFNKFATMMINVGSLLQRANLSQADSLFPDCTMSPTDQSNDRLQRPILHLEFKTYHHYHYYLYTHSFLPYLEEPSERFLKNTESYGTSPNSGFNTRFAASPSPPWSTLSDTMVILFENELKAMYFEQTAIEFRRTEEYRYKWSGCCDPPLAKWNQGAPVLTDRDSIIDFFNKEVMLYIDVDVMRRPIEEFHFPLLGRYLYRTWFRQHDGRPPFQSGGFIVKPMLLQEPLQTDLVQLSTYHTELSKFLSQPLDDLVAFDCYRQPGDTSPSLCPPTQSFRDHGYFMCPLFKALYVVYHNQFDDHDYLDEPMDRGEYEKTDDYRQRFIG